MKTLVERVREIDEDAAQWLQDEAPKMVSYVECTSLHGTMKWNETPQGTAYWFKIALQLYNSEKETGDHHV